MNIRGFASNYYVIAYCAVSLVIVSFLLLGVDGLGPIDDHHLIRTIFQGKSFGAYVLPDLGRFFPLAAQEYVLASKLITPTPSLFYALSAFKALLVGVFLYFCLTLTGAGKLTVMVLWSVVIFSIGMANSAFRLQVGELNILLLTLVFLWSVLASRNSELPRVNRKRVVIGMAAFSMALFYKELSFVLMLAFASSEVIRHRLQAHESISRYLWGVLAVGACYVIFYAVWRAAYVTGSYADFYSASPWQVLTLYAENDPFIVYVVLPVMIHRFIEILRDAKKYDLFDSFLVAAISYFFAYLALGMFNTYYLLPAYGFAACGLAGLAATAMTRYMKPLILMASTLFAVNNATAAYSDTRTLELTANNHWRFVLFLTGWMAGNPELELGKRNLVLVGVSPASGVEIVHSLKTFLTSLGASDASFAVKATEPVDNNVISDFYGMGEKDVQKPKPGDLLIFNPYQKAFTLPTPQTHLYREIYRSDISWAPPRWKAWTWTRVCLLGRAGCSVNIANNRRYAGYAVMLQTRDAGAVTDMRSPNRTGLN